MNPDEIDKVISRGKVYNVKKTKFGGRNEAKDVFEGGAGIGRRRAMREIRKSSPASLLASPRQAVEQ